MVNRKACLLWERTGRWARQLRLTRPEVERVVRQVRVWSEVERLLEEDSRRLVLVSLERDFSPRQCHARLASAALAKRRWPQCRIGFLLDPEAGGWRFACEELDASLLARGLADCRQLADRIVRFADTSAEVEQSARRDPRDTIRERLPWA
ncbi:MAG: hypothetical protein WEE51_08420 [Pirellulaceae bacterium]